jgi:kinesin family protein 3/17
MEEKLAKEKEEIRIKAEMERKKIEQEKTMAEDEKQNLLEKLNKKEEEERKQKEQREKMLKKLKKMESKMLVGNKVMEKAMIQERELMEAKQILENQRINQQRIEEELKKNENMKMDLQKKFSSQQEEIDVKTKQLQKLMENYNSVKAELNDIQDTFNREREELCEQNREYQKSLKLKDLIIHHFIPEEEVQKLEMRAEWSDDKDDWLIPLSNFSGRSIRNKAMQSVYGLKRPVAESSLQQNPNGTQSVRDPKAAFENIAHFDLDLPEDTTDDFGTGSDHPPGTRAVIHAALSNEEDDLRLIQTEIHPNVYFAYTEDGAAIRANMVNAEKKPAPAPARKVSAAPKRQPSAVVRKEESPKMDEDFIPKGKGLVRKKN